LGRSRLVASKPVIARGRRTGGRGRVRTGLVVRHPRDGGKRLIRRLLPAMGHSPAGRWHCATAPPGRTRACARPHPHRAQGVRRRGLAHRRLRTCGTGWAVAPGGRGTGPGDRSLSPGRHARRLRPRPCPGRPFGIRSPARRMAYQRAAGRCSRHCWRGEVSRRAQTPRRFRRHLDHRAASVRRVPRRSTGPPIPTGRLPQGEGLPGLGFLPRDTLQPAVRPRGYCSVFEAGASRSRVGVDWRSDALPLSSPWSREVGRVAAVAKQAGTTQGEHHS